MKGRQVSASTSNQAYENLYHRIEDEVRRGDYRSALRLGRRALHLARELDQQDLVHRAVSNLSVIHLELGHPRRAEQGLREILLRSRSSSIVCAAAYNLAISLRRQKKIERASFFAEKALDKARRMRDSIWLSRSYNLLGNIRLCQSDWDGALKLYRRSLQIRLRMEEDTRFDRAILLDNIGYCWLLKRQYRKGIGLIHQGLALAEEIDSRRYIAETCQDLCFGHMKLDELDTAAACGKRALTVAERHGYSDIVRNCYYLLGEVYNLGGRDELSARYFGKLQDLYPHLPFLREFLSTFDVSDIIALKSP